MNMGAWLSFTQVKTPIFLLQEPATLSLIEVYWIIPDLTPLMPKK